MKILQVITLSSLGGAQTVVVELSNELVKLGHSITVVSNPDGELWDLLSPKITKIQCKYFKREISLINDLRSIIFLKNLINKFNYDIIHLHSSKAGFWGRIAGWECRDKIIYTVHGFDTILKGNRMFLIIEKVLKKFCKYLVPVSEYDKKNLLSNNINNCVVIKNGVRDVKNDLSLVNIFNKHSQNEKIVVSVSRLQYPKNFDLFLQVAEKLGKQGYVFYWVGNRQEVYNLPYNTYCLGEIKGIRSYLHFADIFVLFSYYEGLPVSIIEAFASSVPVVASNVGGIPELLNGKNGIVVNNNVEEVVKAIKRIAEGDLQSFKKEARKTYEEMFTVDKMVNAYLELYKNVSI